MTLAALRRQNRVEVTLQHGPRVHAAVVVRLFVAQTTARTTATAVTLAAAAIVFAQTEIAQLYDATVRDEDVLVGGEERKD